MLHLPGDAHAQVQVRRDQGAPRCRYSARAAASPAFGQRAGAGHLGAQARASSLDQVRSSWRPARARSRPLFCAAARLTEAAGRGLRSRRVALPRRLDKGHLDDFATAARFGRPGLQRRPGQRWPAPVSRKRAFHPHRAAAKDHVARLDAARLQIETASTSSAPLPPGGPPAARSPPCPRRVDPTSSPQGLCFFQQPGQGRHVVIDQVRLRAARPATAPGWPRAPGPARHPRADPAPAPHRSAALRRPDPRRRRSAQPAGHFFRKYPESSVRCHAVLLKQCPLCSDSSTSACAASSSGVPVIIICLRWTWCGARVLITSTWLCGRASQAQVRQGPFGHRFLAGLEDLFHGRQARLVDIGGHREHRRQRAPPALRPHPPGCARPAAGPPPAARCWLMAFSVGRPSRSPSCSPTCWKYRSAEPSPHSTRSTAPILRQRGGQHAGGQARVGLGQRIVHHQHQLIRPAREQVFPQLGLVDLARPGAERRSALPPVQRFDQPHGRLDACRSKPPMIHSARSSEIEPSRSDLDIARHRGSVLHTTMFIHAACLLRPSSAAAARRCCT